ncbi:hypothetical protein MVEN_00060100 [Mycena venus]|uniref:Uncharacterized protein n=1 Tax=Mycena venus TaxID=2733690 RepID=A0A8H6Z7H3_9AGAR|nr:hypothetical protein MVEN_00060100 [Mycena venus]
MDWTNEDDDEDFGSKSPEAVPETAPQDDEGAMDTTEENGPLQVQDHGATVIGGGSGMQALREENARLQAEVIEYKAEVRDENSSLAVKCSKVQVDLDWYKVRVNALREKVERRERELERARDDIAGMENELQASGDRTRKRTRNSDGGYSLSSIASTPMTNNIKALPLPEPGEDIAMEPSDANALRIVIPKPPATTRSLDVRKSAPPRARVDARGYPDLSPRPGLVTPAILACMQQPPRPVEHAVDARGYPIDEDAWWTTFHLQTRYPIWVYALRHFIMWTYGRAVDPEHRTVVQQLAVDNYYCCDWFANALTEIAKNFQDNLRARKHWPTVKKSDIGYDPVQCAQLIQYRESPTRGCKFIDDAYTLNMRHVRGYNLMTAVGPPRIKGAPANERLACAEFEKIYLQVTATPGFYTGRLTDLHITVEPLINIEPWSLDALGDVTADDVVKRLAKCGVSSHMVDDAYAFAISWAQDETAPLPYGWTAEEVGAIANLGSGYPAPPSLFPESMDACPRSPTLPWINEYENICVFEMSGWAAPELAGMRREPNSSIARAIHNNKARPTRDTGLIAKHNPYLKAIRPPKIKARSTATLNLHALPAVALATQPSNNAPAPVPIHMAAAPPTNIPITPRPVGLGASIHAPSNRRYDYPATTAAGPAPVNPGINPQLTVRNALSSAPSSTVMEVHADVESTSS